MARQTKPLNNTQIKQAKAKDKEYNLADGQGLLLRVKPNGTKTWLFNYYKPYTKKRANISFGPYPDLGLADAREKRDDAKKLLAKQIDPKDYRDTYNQQKSLETSQTLGLIAHEWLNIKKSKVSGDHAIDIWRSLELHILPTLGNHPIRSISAPAAIKALQPLATKGRLETVRRVAQRLNEIMVYAVNSGIIHSNPLAGIKETFQAPKKQHLPTIKPEELTKFLTDLKNANIQHTTRALMEWQLHTMVRPSEAAGARWEEIDFKAKLWTIPAERMKKKKSHSVPITGQAIEILERIKPMSANREHIFPSERNPKTHANSQTANMALKRMGYGGKLVAHGFRSLASTTLNEKGFNPDIIEVALAHVDGNEVRKAYNRAEYLEQRRVMMCWWSDLLSKPSKDQPTTNFISIQKSGTDE